MSPASVARARTARRLRSAAAVGVAGVALFALRDRIPDPDAVWASVQRVNLGWLAVAVIAEGLSMRLFAGLLRRLLRSGGITLTRPRSVAVAYARNAVSSSLPAGPVLSVAFTIREFGRLGASKPLSVATLVLSAVYSTATFTVLGLVALLGGDATRGPALIALAAVAAAVFALARLRRRAGGRRSGASRRILAAREAIRPTGRDRLVLAVLALANWLLDLACLAAVCAAAGVGLGPHTVLLGYVAGKIAATLAVVPGGLGVAELGMAATFVGAGVTGSMAAAVVALYRLISYWAVLAAGWVAWLLLRDGVRARLAAAGRWLLGVLGRGEDEADMRPAG
ncbi:lysylphosphatidylglycerol synthase transmembrane domain-containing protein [Microbispora sp. CA-102843]|uniref:lysylphosphatidylglycerol synthase transmembrane domain-containing protein n=1 Tax=Microbispora sp. CA-102843 TaxID=3239952 RepID=UPI003D916998